uniref:SJCHGC05307 protein n=1 Tax=Schistosoma japonicum TaxID=6182 RepID=Q5DCA3_SCHJA|nr:SJCHGC05307 protein [Schistosoma japonicum]
MQPDSVSPIKVSKTNFPDPATGIAIISNLIFSEAGQSNLAVSVISPDGSIRLNASISVTVKARQLSLSLHPVQSNSDDSMIKSIVNQNFSIQVNITDKQTGASVANINWRNLIWNFTGDICSNSRKPKDILTNSPSTLLYNSSTTNNGFIWTINGFQSSWVYAYCISAIAYSNDGTTRQSQYDLPLTKIRIQVNPQNYTEPSRNAKKQYRFKVSGSYANILPYIDEFTAAIQSELLTRFPNVLFDNITFSEGSIAVDLVASSDSITVVETALNSFTSALNDGNVAFSVGGVSYTATSDKKNAGYRSTNCMSSMIIVMFSLLIYQF